MAAIGANYPCFKPNDGASGVVIGKLVSANLSINLATGQLDADDHVAESASEFHSGSIAMQTDDLEDEKAKVIYGCSVSEGVVTYNTDDKMPEGTLAYFQTLMRKGVKFYKAFIYPRAKAAIGNINVQTKGSSITFQAANINWTILADEEGNWMDHKTFSTAKEAKDWINEKCKIGNTAEASSSEQSSAAEESDEEI